MAGQLINADEVFGTHTENHARNLRRRDADLSQQAQCRHAKDSSHQAGGIELPPLRADSIFDLSRAREWKLGLSEPERPYC